MPISSFLAPSAIAKPGVCTSSTRPASPYQGQAIYETDTNKLLIWNGTAWNPPSNMPWGVLGVSTLTTLFNTSAPHTTAQDEGLSASITYGANRRLRVTLSVRPYVPGGANFVTYKLLRGSTEIKNWGLGQNDLSTFMAPTKTLMAVITTPSTAATETFKLQIVATTNTQVSSYAAPDVGGDGGRQMVIEDIGPA
jgi:hypothetical protein